MIAGVFQKALALASRLRSKLNEYRMDYFSWKTANIVGINSRNFGCRVFIDSGNIAAAYIPVNGDAIIVCPGLFIKTSPEEAEFAVSHAMVHGSYYRLQMACGDRLALHSMFVDALRFYRDNLRVTFTTDVNISTDAYIEMPATEGDFRRLAKKLRGFFVVEMDSGGYACISRENLVAVVQETHESRVRYRVVCHTSTIVVTPESARRAERILRRYARVSSFGGNVFNAEYISFVAVQDGKFTAVLGPLGRSGEHNLEIHGQYTGDHLSLVAVLWGIANMSG